MEYVSIFLAASHTASGILVPRGIEPVPLNWRPRVLTAGPPGKSQAQGLQQGTSHRCATASSFVRRTEWFQRFRLALKTPPADQKWLCKLLSGLCESIAFCWWSCGEVCGAKQVPETTWPLAV